MTVVSNICCYGQYNYQILGEHHDLFEISKLTYEYNLTYSDNLPITYGALSLIVNFDAPIKEFRFYFTHQHYVINNRIFYNNRKNMTNFNDDDRTVEINLDKIDWGTYFCFKIFFKDGTVAESDVYCTTDMLSEEDRQIVWDYSGVDNVETTESRIIYHDNSIIVDTECGGELSVYDINGVNIKNIQFETRQPIGIDESFPKFFFAVARLDNGQILTKKILR